MVIRSGKGDFGYTELLFKSGISKDSPEMKALGNLDELNSFLGLLKVKIKKKKYKEWLESMQRAIYAIMSEITVGPEKKKRHGAILSIKDVEWIESIEKELEQKADIEKHFYLPGKNELSSMLDVVRTVARRAERSVVGLFKDKRKENEHILRYLNCLSDVFFILARTKTRRKKRSRGKKV